MMLFDWLKRKAARKQAAERLYQAALMQSRESSFYEVLGVADTMDGRFDLLSLHIYLVVDRLERLGPEGQRLAQSLFDCLFINMDRTLRETGVGDLSVPRHMKAMMKAFNGRAHVYREALEPREVQDLERAISRNIYRAKDDAIPNGATRMAAYVFETAAAFSHYSLDDFMNDSIQFLSVLHLEGERLHA